MSKVIYIEISKARKKDCLYLRIGDVSGRFQMKSKSQMLIERLGIAFYEFIIIYFLAGGLILCLEENYNIFNINFIGGVFLMLIAYSLIHFKIKWSYDEECQKAGKTNEKRN